MKKKSSPTPHTPVPDSEPGSPLPQKNTKTLLLLLAIALGMLGVAYAFVPLYRMFCEALGIPIPSIMVGDAAAPKYIGPVSDRQITIRFQANNADGVPVTLAPGIRRAKVNIGEPFLTAYTAQNLANRKIDGIAVHTILALGGPPRTDIQDYIQLEQCFCFEEQTYPANQTVNLPLQFTITNDLPEGIHTITFAYTLYETKT